MIGGGAPFRAAVCSSWWRAFSLRTLVAPRIWSEPFGRRPLNSSNKWLALAPFDPGWAGGGYYQPIESITICSNVQKKGIDHI